MFAIKYTQKDIDIYRVENSKLMEYCVVSDIYGLLKGI